MKSSLACTALTVAIHDRILVSDLELNLLPGEFIGILGPNGVGKTLTMLTLAGLRTPRQGTVQLTGRNIADLDRSTIARELGMLLQAQDDAFPTTVIENAILGAYARLGLWQTESIDDERAATHALKRLDLAGLEQQTSSTLSSGERQRLAIARLLVQDPAILLLDEPTSHLDPLHQLTVLSLMSGLTDQGKIIVASIHDPVLASRFCSSVLLVHGNGRWEFGPATDLLAPEYLEQLYGVPFTRYHGAEQSVSIPSKPM